MRAWDELDGMPKYQVIRFQEIAPIRPAMITYTVTSSMTTSPLPIVFAMWTSNTSAATRLKNAAHMTAFLGVRTRVETTVAMEFAAS